MIQDRFDPWRVVEARDDVILARHPIAAVMGGGFHATRQGFGVIVIDPDLSGVDQRAVLTHELVHHERGGAVERLDAPSSWQTVVEREERSVDREVARRLVPAEELDSLVAECRATGSGVSASDVVAPFEAPPGGAARALERRAARHEPGTGRT